MDTSENLRYPCLLLTKQGRGKERKTMDVTELKSRKGCVYLFAQAGYVRFSVILQSGIQELSQVQM